MASRLLRPARLCAVRASSALTHNGSSVTESIIDAFPSSLSSPASPASPFAPSRSSSSMPNAVWFEAYNRQRQQLPLHHLVPDVAVDAWLAPNAVVIGGVTVEDRASIWYGAVVRGDLNYVTVGAYSNLQDRVVVHAASASPTGLSAETRIGRYVTVGQGSVLRSCEIEDEVIIGQRCIVLEGAIVEKNAILGDGTVVGPGQLVPAGQLWAGNPARFVRSLTADEKMEIARVADGINRLAGEHSEEYLPFSSAYIQAERLRESLQAMYKKKAEEGKH